MITIEIFIKFILVDEFQIDIDRSSEFGNKYPYQFKMKQYDERINNNE